MILIICMLFTEAHSASAALQITSESLVMGATLHMNESSFQKWQL